MSWTYPTQQEAEDAYNDNKRKYNSAAQSLETSKSNQKSYEAQKKSDLLKIASGKTEKMNLEKRVKQLEKIIKMLEGNGGFLSQDVPSEIVSSNKASVKVDNSYKKCIVCDSIPAASLDNVFNSKSVTADANSNSALQGFKKEKQKVEQTIANIKKSINTLTSEISSLNSKIANCNYEQLKLKANMASYTYEMNHYKWYM